MDYNFVFKEYCGVAATLKLAVYRYHLSSTFAVVMCSAVSMLLVMPAWLTRRACASGGSVVLHVDVHGA